VRITFTVHGSVQGVGYRYFVQDEAELLGVAGWVRNAYDGTVVGEAEGAAEVMEVLRASLERGPRSARVTRLDWFEVDGAESLPRPFQIRR
jgi:acylphosphatase